jgi:AmmeMemoRadiSam system protein B
VLGPSHHFYSRQCHLSPHREYATPLGAASIDAEVYAALSATGAFPLMSPAADEAEHSLELHLPFIMEVMRGHSFTLVPILVGALSAAGEAEYGAALAPYLADPANFVVVSSDFCHWGARFSFTFHDPGRGNIHQSVEWLDREGMALIEQGDPLQFTAYLKEYGNTICGRHPIGVFLNVSEGLDQAPRMRRQRGMACWVGTLCGQHPAA